VENARNSSSQGLATAGAAREGSLVAVMLPRADELHERRGPSRSSALQGSSFRHAGRSRPSTARGDESRETPPRGSPPGLKTSTWQPTTRTRRRSHRSASSTRLDASDPEVRGYKASEALIAARARVDVRAEFARQRTSRSRSSPPAITSSTAAASVAHGARPRPARAKT